MKVLLYVLCVLHATLARPESDALSSNLVSHSTLHTGTINKLIRILEGGILEEPRGLKRVFLTSRNGNATCNDGSPAGFYLRRSHGSKRWIIFLEGGWYCHDRRSCQARWLRLQNLMSSKQWPDTRSVGGVLSSNPEENAYWYNANHVFVPYCTSDAWSGTRRPDADARFSFLGSNVVHQVVRDLVPLGLANGTTLILAGSSAGGTGVMVNLDSISDLVTRRLKLSHMTVMGVADSGWFLDRNPFAPGTHSSAHTLRRGAALWSARLPQRCAAQHSAEQWRCFFGYRVYPTIRAPLFIFQWLFDEAQMTADNVGAPVTKQQWDFIHKTGDSLRHSFQNVSSVFAPSCISHSVLTKRDWQTVRVAELTLPQALHCWELAHTAPGGGKVARHLVRSGGGNKTRSQQQRKRKKHKRKNRKEKQERQQRQERLERLERKERQERRQKRELPHCQHRVIERCSWPQCNPSCPKLTNPLTGNEMDFIDLLKSFGLNMSSVAAALGIDLHTLHNMDHSELLHLLTQQTN